MHLYLVLKLDNSRTLQTRSSQRKVHSLTFRVLTLLWTRDSTENTQCSIDIDTQLPFLQDLCHSTKLSEEVGITEESPMDSGYPVKSLAQQIMCVFTHNKTLTDKYPVVTRRKGTQSLSSIIEWLLLLRVTKS